MSSPVNNKFAAARLLNSATKLDSPRLHGAVLVESKDEQNKYGSGQPKDYTPQQINDLLANYDEVSANDWSDIRIGSHVRYVKKDGNFKPGGFVRVKGNDYFVLENIPFSSKQKSPDYVHWIIKFANVSKIFTKKKSANPGTNVNNNGGMPTETASTTIIPPVSAPEFNPIPQIDTAFMQQQIDALEKKISMLESQYRRSQEDIADLTVFAKKVGKYIQSKGVDLTK